MLAASEKGEGEMRRKLPRRRIGYSDDARRWQSFLFEGPGLPCRTSSCLWLASPALQEWRLLDKGACVSCLRLLLHLCVSIGGRISHPKRLTRLKLASNALNKAVCRPRVLRQSKHFNFRILPLLGRKGRWYGGSNRSFVGRDTRLNETNLKPAPKRPSCASVSIVLVAWQ